MRIVGLNTLNGRGGAAKVAERLGAALRARGHDYGMLVGHRPVEDATVEELRYPRWSRELNVRLRLRGLALPTARVIQDHPWVQVADVVNLHNLHSEPYGYFNIRDLPTLARAKPTLWSLHDPWIVYEDGRTPEYDPIFSHVPPLAARQKRRAIEDSNVTFVAPSQWLAELVTRSYPEKRLELIPHGVNTATFYPLDKVTARAALGMPMDKKIVLFIAHGGEANTQKGGVFVNAAREALGSEGVEFVTLGSHANGSYVEEASALATHYSAADVLLLPSAAENFSLVALEAMACGTPVAAFRVGGLPEVVTHLRDGYLADYGDTNDLLSGLSFVLEDPSAARFGEEAARRVRREFSLEQMTDRYLRVYSEISAG